MRANIDQYYISKVDVDQAGTFEFDGQQYQLRVSKIYTEVSNDSFRVDMEFEGLRANGIKRGQTLQIDLSLSESKTTRVLSKGGFYRHTNGRWVYRISDDGTRAVRVDVVAGRHNPQSFEILDGLNSGDRVITSSYDLFNDVDEITFTAPI